MKSIALDELPHYSPWPERLLRGVQTARRTPERVEAEYDQGLYAKLLETAERTDRPLIEDIRLIALGEPGREVAMSIGPALYALPLERAMARSEEVHLNQLGRHLQGIRTVVDLGCGYGHLLSRFRLMYPTCAADLRGGDISPTAVRLAQRFGIQADTFSFLDDVCAPLDHAQPPVLVVTAYALHQLPSAAPAVRLLARYRDKIAAVVCLEPEADFFGDGLLGLLRHAYGRANDYSADLLRVLEARGDTRVLYYVQNAIGANALLPGTISAWKFR